MIQVDISNVWGQISLPDLLSLEKEVFDAHNALTEGTGAGCEYTGWLNLPMQQENEEILRIQRAAERIRSDSDVFVVIGINTQKRRTFEAEKMKTAIEAALQELDIANVKVIIYEGLVAEFAKQHQIKYMIRGLRNNMDYNYEENIAEVNKLINPDMEYVYFRAVNVAVSSSMVKELHSFGLDVSPYLPKAVYDML